MNEEQIKQKFKETYPDFMRGDEPLSPYFDIWEYAIETVTSEMQEGLDKIREMCELSLECKQSVFDKKINELQVKFDKRLKRHCNTIHSLVDELERRQNAEKELQKKVNQLQGYLDHDIEYDIEQKNIELQKENKKLKTDYEVLSCSVGDFGELQENLEEEQRKNNGLEEKIADLKDYILKVSKFLHNNYNTRPDELAYKERDKLLIKELKLFEKWEL